MLNPFAYPSFVLWAARLIWHKHPESLGVIKRVIRSRLMLGTQMSEVEGSYYERGLGLFLVIDLGFLPATLIFGYLSIYGPLFSPDFTPIDFFYALLGTVACASVVVAPIIFLGMPFLGRNAAKKHKIRPQPFEAMTDHVVSYPIVKYYLKHIKRHRIWNPLYRLYWYAAATGSHWAGIEGHTHQKDSRFLSYSAIRAMYPTIPFGLTLCSLLILSELPKIYSSLFWFLMSNIFMLFLHLSIGRAHPDLFLNFDVKQPVVITRALAAKLAAVTAIGTFISVNFEKIRTWLSSFL